MVANANSMPSSHAANWFGALMVAFIYYRRSLWFMLPCALVVSFSRIYNGVHYPSDVLAGAILGAGYAAATAWSLNALWQWAGRKWFPLWWKRFPSLLDPVLQPAEEEEAEPLYPAGPLPGSRRRADGGTRPSAAPLSRPVAPHATLDQHWFRLGCIVIVVLLVAQWAFLASGVLQLTEDEAYQWVWSKHLALSYYSKPPLIAYTQFLGTTLAGDTAFGVRFFSPFITALTSFLLLRFFAREINARAGFFLLLITTATPLLAGGAVLMTVDPLSVLFWIAAMLAGWRAMQDKATTADWLWVGLWMGLGFLSKYTELFQWLCWVVFFILWPPARKQLRRPGPYLALLINILCATPVLVWNAQRGWPTVAHVADDAQIGKAAVSLFRHLRDLGEFLGLEFLALNPVFFVAMVWAAIAFWRRGRHNPRMVYFFSMGAPLFLSYLLWSLHSRILANWIAPSVVPLFCLMVVYWDTRWRLGAARLKSWLITGLCLGFLVVILGHDTNLIAKLGGHPLPANFDPINRARGWGETARVVERARQELLSEGKPVFIIGDHYGITGQLTFWLPEARATIHQTPLVYYRRAKTTPENQFNFWPGYDVRQGQNAIFVRILHRDHGEPMPAPAWLQNQFESVADLGIVNVMNNKKQVIRSLQLFACRHLREFAPQSAIP
jgi:4-amino-4-deoxy-L-arabinose transferase-like glycosyltransferase